MKSIKTFAKLLSVCVRGLRGKMPLRSVRFYLRLFTSGGGEQAFGDGC